MMMSSIPDTGFLQERLLSVAQELFIEYEYHGLAVRKISEAVGVSKASLYYYFRDKEQPFLAGLYAYFDEMEAFIDSLNNKRSTVRQRIKSLIQYILSQPPSNRAMIRLANQEMPHLTPNIAKELAATYDAKFLKKIQKIIIEGIRAGELRHIDAPTASWLLLDMLYPFTYSSLPGAHFSLDELAEEISTVFYYGVSLLDG